MKKLIELNPDSSYKNDYIIDAEDIDELTKLPESWTADIPPDGMYIPTYVVGEIGDLGEKKGGVWEDRGSAPPLTAEQILQASTAQVYALTRQANAQVSALSGRVTTLDYLLNGQDEDDPDYIEPTAADIEELAQRKAQLKTWNSYAIKLGRITSAVGWSSNPTWPKLPEPYTSETSAVATPFS